MTKKFIVDGREVESFYLTPKELVSLFNTLEDKEDKEFITQMIVDDFARLTIPKNGETKDALFARNFSDFVNGQMESPYKVAEVMAKDHRYLQQQMFKVCYYYIELLSQMYENGYYDGRNEWSCETAHKMIEVVKE